MRNFAAQSTRLVMAALVASGLLISGQAQRGTNGEQIFSSNCAACHGLDGKGGEHAPNIASTAAVQQKSDAELANIIRKGISGAGMPGFRTLLDDSQIEAVLRYLRTLQQSESRSAARGDPGRGRAMFFGAGRCAECHMIDGRGGFLGADLSGYGATHQAAAIRDWILHPDQDAEAQRGMIAVVTREGRHYRGLVRNEDNFSLQIQSLDGSFRLLDKSDLVRVVRETRSVMPDDYAKKLSPADLDDVVAFLTNVKSK